MIKYASIILSILFLICCSNKNNKIDYDYPKSAQEVKENRAGSLRNSRLITGIIGNDHNRPVIMSNNKANNDLWRAALDIVSFMPLNSVDSASGIIITDWYNDPIVPKERFKANIMIYGEKLRINAVKVNMFKQIQDSKSNWIDTYPSENLSIELEDKIINRAKQIKLSTQ